MWFHNLWLFENSTSANMEVSLICISDHQKICLLYYLAEVIILEEIKSEVPKRPNYGHMWKLLFL